MPKSADAFRTISEVAEWLETPAHVLRFWESKFSQVKPVKRAGGRRYYRPADMKLLGGIKKLLHEDGMTIKGVQKMLREQGIKHVAALSQPLDEVTDIVASEMAENVTPQEATGTVLSFDRSDAAPAGPEEDGPETPEPETPEPAMTEPDEAEAEESVAEPPAMVFRHAAAPLADPPSGQEEKPPATPEMAHEDAGPPPPEPEATTQESEGAAAETATVEDDAQADTPAPAAPTPAPLAVTVPDDPPDDMQAEPGMLTTLAARTRVPARLTPALADLAARLKARHG